MVKNTLEVNENGDADTAPKISRRRAVAMGLATAAGAALALGIGGSQENTPKVESAGGPPYELVNSQLFPRLVIDDLNINSADTFGELVVLQKVVLGSSHPNVSTIVGMDFLGDIETSALTVFRPKETVKETRVVFIKTPKIETVELERALGGERLDIRGATGPVEDKTLKELGLKYAESTARKGQKVVFVGILQEFEEQHGAQERPLLDRMILAQRPGNAALEIAESDYAYSQTFIK